MPGPRHRAVRGLESTFGSSDTSGTNVGYRTVDRDLPVVPLLCGLALWLAGDYENDGFLPYLLHSKKRRRPSSNWWDRPQ